LFAVNVSGGTLAFATNDQIGSLTVSAASAAQFGSGAAGNVGTASVSGTLNILNGNGSTFGATAVNSGGSANVYGTGTFTSLTVNSGGTVTIGDGATGGAGSVTGTIADNGLVIVNRPDSFAFSSVLTGSGLVEKRVASSAATFSGNNSG